MNFHELKELVSQGENDTLEFKESTGQLSKGVESLCAFLNYKGGAVLFGIKDNKEIIGQMVSDKTKRQIVSELNKITPKVDFEIQYVDLENSDRKVIIIQAISDYEKAPYMFDGRAYFREQTSTLAMNQARYDAMLASRLKMGRKWDKEIVNEYTVNDLDLEEIYKCILEGVNSQRLPESMKNESIERQLEFFNLLVRGKLTNAAMVLFARKLDSNFMHSKIKLARFIGNDTAKGFLDEQECSGNVFVILHEAEKFIRKHLYIGILYNENSFERTDKPSLPILAIREALVNSVCHRDYLLRGSAVTVAIFNDRLEIWNPGKLLPEVTLAELKLPLHISLHRNELLARVFYYRKLIEGWGTGTSRILSLCKEYGLYEPTFSERGEGFLVVFKFEFRANKLSEREKLILTIINEMEISTRGIKAQLDKREIITVRTLNRDLKHLQELGFVKSLGAGKTIVWKKA